ncbi:hypothetical protein DICA3_D24586 [Diutina catenulata]
MTLLRHGVRAYTTAARGFALPKNVYGTLWALLQADRVAAATTLLHALPQAHPIPHELWSAYVSRVCLSASHLGAIMTYHRLIDPIPTDPREEPVVTAPLNSRVPFLLSGETLVSLATVFARHRDPARVDGLLDYFKRYYSYSGHRAVFKQLLIVSVEARAVAGDFDGAISQMVRLLSYLRSKHEDWSSLGQVAQKVAFETFKARRESIQKGSGLDESDQVVNPEDIGEDSWPLYLPITPRNSLRTSKGTLPVLNGTVEVSDCPSLVAMLTEHLEKQIEAPSFLSETSALVERTHIGLLPFMVAAIAPQSPQMAESMVRLVAQRHKKSPVVKKAFDAMARAVPESAIPQVHRFYKEIYPSANDRHLVVAIVGRLLQSESREALDKFLEGHRSPVTVPKHWTTAWDALPEKLVPQ